MYANDLGILTRSKSITKQNMLGVKTPLPSHENTLGTNQVFAEVLHLLAEVWSRWPYSKAKSGKPGFPFEEHAVHDEHDHEKDEFKIKTRYKNLRLHVMSSKHGPGYP